MAGRRDSKKIVYFPKKHLQKDATGQAKETESGIIRGQHYSRSKDFLKLMSAEAARGVTAGVRGVRER